MEEIFIKTDSIENWILKMIDNCKIKGLNFYFNTFLYTNNKNGAKSILRFLKGNYFGNTISIIFNNFNDLKIWN